MFFFPLSLFLPSTGIKKLILINVSVFWNQNLLLDTPILKLDLRLNLSPSNVINSSTSRNISLKILEPSILTNTT